MGHALVVHVHSSNIIFVINQEITNLYCPSTSSILHHRPTENNIIVFTIMITVIYLVSFWKVRKFDILLDIYFDLDFLM